MGSCTTTTKTTTNGGHLGRRRTPFGVSAIPLAFCVVMMLASISVPLIAAQDDDAAPRRVTFTIRNRFLPSPGTESITWTTLVPTTIPDRQFVHRIDYSHRPQRIFRRHGNTYATFELKEPRGPVVIDITVTADLLRGDLRTVSARRTTNDATTNDATASDATASDTASSDDSARGDDDTAESSPDGEAPEDDPPAPSSRLDAWLRSEKYLEADDPAIREAIDAIDQPEPLDRVRAILSLVDERLRYVGFQEESFGAARAFEERRGDCSEFADLFVAACRAAGLPARTCDGLLIAPVPSGDTARHKWAEVHLEEIGWVEVDPLRIAKRTATLHRMPNEYLRLSHLRNDRTLNGYEVAYYRYRGEPIEFENELLLHDPAEIDDRSDRERPRRSPESER
jgi:transglutaminase-like putative cysteine protease